MDIKNCHFIAYRRKPFLVSLLMLLSALMVGCWNEKNEPAVKIITIDEVISRLSESDRKLNSFSSQVRVTTYDLDGNLLNQSKTGLRFYRKPDMSMLCLKSEDGETEIYSEVGQ
ncbi:MAG: hypothetical protein ACE5NG_14625, partial [bacterium]